MIWLTDKIEFPPYKLTTDDGIIALGCVIRGDTPHFDYVCHGCASGLQQVTLDTNLPIGFSLELIIMLGELTFSSAATILGEVFFYPNRSYWLSHTNNNTFTIYGGPL